jgi:hypothetical protein
MPVSPIVIAIVVMVVVVLGAVGFLVFASSGDKTEVDEVMVVEETTSDDSNTSTESKTTCTAIDETSCKTFIDKREPEAFYDESWCKKKYATLSTTTKFCAAAGTALDTYVKSLATKFNDIKLIKATQGKTATYYYDSTSTTANPSPSTLTVSAIEKDGDKGYRKTANIKGTDDLLNLLQTAELGKLTWQIQYYVMEHVSAALGITTNIDSVGYDSTLKTFKKGTTALTGTDIRKYTAVPSVWTTIGPGDTHTYSYLNLTTEAQTELLNELKKADISVSRFAVYCA